MWQEKDMPWMVWTQNHFSPPWRGLNASNDTELQIPLPSPPPPAPDYHFPFLMIQKDKLQLIIFWYEHSVSIFKYPIHFYWSHWSALQQCLHVY